MMQIFEDMSSIYVRDGVYDDAEGFSFNWDAEVGKSGEGVRINGMTVPEIEASLKDVQNELIEHLRKKYPDLEDYGVAFEDLVNVLESGEAYNILPEEFQEQLFRDSLVTSSFSAIRLFNAMRDLAEDISKWDFNELRQEGNIENLEPEEPQDVATYNPPELAEEKSKEFPIKEV
jgi:hypothetical protein